MRGVLHKALYGIIVFSPNRGILRTTFFSSAEGVQRGGERWPRERERDVSSCGLHPGPANAFDSAT